MMKPSAPDAFDAIDMDDYMTVLAIIANADAVLRPEEMSFFEWRMGRMLINPKLRVQFRALLRQEFNIEETIVEMDIRTLRLALRDGIFLAAADGSLIVCTDRRMVYCFADVPEASAATGQPLEMVQTTATAQSAAKEIISKTKSID